MSLSLFQFLIDKQTHSGKLNPTMLKPMFEFSHDIVRQYSELILEGRTTRELAEK